MGVRARSQGLPPPHTGCIGCWRKGPTHVKLCRQEGSSGWGGNSPVPPNSEMHKSLPNSGTLKAL